MEVIENSGNPKPGRKSGEFGSAWFLLEKLSEGLANILKDRRFAEFQSYVMMKNLFKENFGDDLKEFLQQASQVWRQENEKTWKALVNFVKVYLEEDKK